MTSLKKLVFSVFFITVFGSLSFCSANLTADENTTKTAAEETDSTIADISVSFGTRGSPYWWRRNDDRRNYGRPYWRNHPRYYRYGYRNYYPRYQSPYYSDPYNYYYNDEGPGIYFR